jgi:hypothetical protein
MNMDAWYDVVVQDADALESLQADKVEDAVTDVAPAGGEPLFDPEADPEAEPAPCA